MKKTAVFLAAIMLWLGLALTLSDALAGVTIRMGHVGAPISPQQQAGDIFVKLVQTKTSGAVEIKLFGGSTLGTEQQLQEGVKAGSIDGLIAGTWERFIPWAGVFQAPFIFRDYDHFQKVVTGPVGQELMAAVEGELGVKPLFIVQHASFRRITNSARPIHKPEDMKGLKIRSLPELGGDFIRGKPVEIPPHLLEPGARDQERRETGGGEGAEFERRIAGPAELALPASHGASAHAGAGATESAQSARPKSARAHAAPRATKTRFATHPATAGTRSAWTANTRPTSLASAKFARTAPGPRTEAATAKAAAMETTAAKRPPTCLAVHRRQCHDVVP